MQQTLKLIIMELLLMQWKKNYFVQFDVKHVDELQYEVITHKG